MLPIIPIALSLAPMLARWLGGTEAGAVAQQVSQAARAVIGSDDPAAVQAAIEADPAKRADLAVELARIAAEREQQQHQALLEELRVAAADRADARAMARAGGPLVWGAGLVTIAAFLLLAVVLGVLAFVNVPEGNRDVLQLLAGTVAAMAGGAATFWVGSSAGSAGKSGLLGGPFGQGRG